MTRPVTAFVLALASVILTPVLLFIEFTALFFASMVTYEPANPLWVKVIVVVVVVLIGLFTLSVPVAALIVGIRARAAAKLAPTKGAGLATAAVVIAGIVAAGTAAVHVYLILMSIGLCSLEGC